MRIEKINENKIKVLIDTDEAREWNISAGNMASDSPAVQEMFRTAIRLAQQEVRFSIDGAKLFVEAIPEHTDGFGMLITRIFSDKDLNAAVANCSYRGKIKKRCLYPENAESKIKSCRIFRFGDFDNVCRAAEAIHRDFSGDSMLYKCDGSYYMLLAPDDIRIMLSVEKIMLEFSDKQNRTLISHGRLNELGEIMIRHDAVNVLVEYFS